MYYAFEIFRGNTPSAEDVAVSKVLCGQVADWEFAQYDLCASFIKGLELVVNYLPFCIHNGLVLGNLFYADFGIVLFALELELHVQADDLRISKDLRLLFESGIGEGLLERDTIDEE